MPKPTARTPQKSAALSLLDAIVPRRRRAPTARHKATILQKTGGLCHICGGELDARWTADHVKPFAKGGENGIDNFLPACGVCNRLKWHRTPEVIRVIMQLGIYARKEIEHDTPLGRQMAALFRRREASNTARRTVKA
jgi:5-methylcytosine-specific restriction endonuclease McrA